MSTTTTLSGGDSVTVVCEGGGRLTQQRLSRTSMRDTCRGTTTSSSTTTSSTTTTTQPGSGGGGGGAGGGGGGAGTRSCTSNPQGNLGPYDYSGITNSNGFNTYVSNNMWGAQGGTTQTVCGTSPGAWTLTARTTQDQGGAVQTYPDVQQLTNNWTGNGWGPCGNCADTPINRLTSLTSTFNITNPPTSQGAWQAAYDIWTSSGEFMIWTTYSDFRIANNGAQVLNPDVVVGDHYTDMNYGGGLEQMVVHGNPASGTVDILAVLRYWIAQGKLAANATIGQARLRVGDLQHERSHPELRGQRLHTVDGRLTHP